MPGAVAWMCVPQDGAHTVQNIVNQPGLKQTLVVLSKVVGHLHSLRRRSTCSRRRRR